MTEYYLISALLGVVIGFAFFQNTMLSKILIAVDELKTKVDNKL